MSANLSFWQEHIFELIFVGAVLFGAICKAWGDIVIEILAVSGMLLFFGRIAYALLGFGCIL